jgi:hypothetical protein
LLVKQEHPLAVNHHGNDVHIRIPSMYNYLKNWETDTKKI